MRSALWQQTGGIWPLGISCSLTWYDLGAIVHLLQIRNIRAVVEIGVEHGGLGVWLAAYRQITDCAYLGIDINLQSLAPAARAWIGQDVRERDAWAADTRAEVEAWIHAQPGPALIFCDGGNKPKELMLYAPLLRPGDVLLGHDYHNEYTDAAIADVPAQQVRADWLDDTLLCMFVRPE